MAVVIVGKQYLHRKLPDAQEYHLRQVAIGITRGKEGNGIGGNKHGSADLDGCLCRSKGVVLDDALVGIVVNQMAATQRIGKRERHIMLQDMPITRHIDPLFTRFPVDHIVVGTVLPRDVVLPSAATQVMVGVQAVRLVMVGHAMVDVVLRTDCGALRRTRLHAIAAGLETVTVACRQESGGVARVNGRTIAVVEGPAMVELHRSEVVDQVETVVAVTPGATITDGVARVGGILHVDAEAVDIAAISAFAKVVVVVVCIAVQYEIVGACRLVIADGHPVVHGDVFHDAMRALACRDAFRLGVALDPDWHADDVEVAQMEVVGTEIECAKTKA